MSSLFAEVYQVYGCDNIESLEPAVKLILQKFLDINTIMILNYNLIIS